MKQVQPNALARSLWDFFHEYLPGLRGMSPHTIHSYRDTFVLLLRFLAATKHLDAAAVDLAHLDPQTIIAYLTYLEEARHNQATTRNVRLAAIHAFFRYIAARHPERLEQAQRILGIPFKRTSSQPWTWPHETLLVKSPLHKVPPGVTRDGVPVGQSVPASVGARSQVYPGARQ
jgi:hypothetical protein